MSKIIRVFPERTSYTPTDPYAFVGMPTLMIPEHEEVRISCTFTWDKQKCEDLKYQWEVMTNKPVKLGGPAYNSPCTDFIPGMYVKQGIIFTSRGCDNNCPFCCVPKREGKIKELPIVEGNIIQDNNFLQTSREHKDKVFEMLKHQHAIEFKGGLQSNLIDDHFISNIQSLKIKSLYLACDSKGSIPSFKKACAKLVKAGFNRNKIRCFALIGDDMQENEERCREIYYAGAMPFAQLYKDFSETKTEYSKEWRQFCRKWSRPAATNAYMKGIIAGGVE
mgnify:CR=1 FL=1|jgi:hypothetical protein